MDKEMVYEYIEEADKRELMELLDAVVNRFWELHSDRELIVISVPAGEDGDAELEQIMEMLKRQRQNKENKRKKHPNLLSPY